MSHHRQRFVDQSCDKMSFDSQFTDAEEVSFLEACVDCDDDALYDIIQNGVTWDQVNERDKSARVSLYSHINCFSRNIIYEMCFVWFSTRVFAWTDVVARAVCKLTIYTSNFVR